MHPESISRAAGGTDDEIEGNSRRKQPVALRARLARQSPVELCDSITQVIVVQAEASYWPLQVRSGATSQGESSTTSALAQSAPDPTRRLCESLG